MSAYSELQPYFDAYQGEIHKAKNASGMTLSELAESSGVPYNNVCDINAGRAKQPLLYYAAAICKVFGLSLNKLMGLDEPESSTLALRERVHELELQVTSLKGEVRHLKSVKETDDEEKERLIKEVAAWEPIVYILLFLSTVLVASLGYYLVMDFHLSDVGLILFGKLSIYGAVLILILFVSLGTIAWIAIREIRAWRRSVRDSERERK